MISAKIDFMIECDRLKSIIRRTLLIDKSRLENSAEHSWSLSLAIILFANEIDPDVDVLKAVKMAIVHDLVEIYADDTFLYDEVGRESKLEREIEAAKKLFNKEPADKQLLEFKSIWEEYEKKTSREAKFVYAFDRLLPLVHNWKTKGKAWQDHNISSDKVLKFNIPIKDTNPKLWDFAKQIIEESIQKGYLRK